MQKSIKNKRGGMTIKILLIFIQIQELKKLSQVFNHLKQ